MELIYLLLLIAAAVCFALGAFRPTVATRVNLIALGLFLWVLVEVLQMLLGLEVK